MVQHNSTGGRPWNGTNMTFKEIAKKLGVSRQCINHAHNRLMTKIANALAEDPYVRDWLIDNNYKDPTHDKENDQ